MIDIDKIIVSNRSRLLEKYGSAGLKKIEQAVKKLIAHDKTRGIDSLLVYVDDDKHMSAAGAPAVLSRRSPEQNKIAVDALCKKYTPDYILLLGSRDVIPHAELNNLIAAPDKDGNGDEDREVYSDLPYACEARYSEHIADFLNPVRVVGRLPDITGGTDVSYLVRLVENAIKVKPSPAKEYKDYFAVSAAVWSGSSRLTLTNVFRNHKKLLLCPPTDARKKPFTPSQLKPKVHFINCHGGKAQEFFQGEGRKESEEIQYALDTRNLVDKVSFGTVAAAECCYGADLFPVLGPGRISIANNYLGHGAVGYMGSTTIAYGLFRVQQNADLLTEYFLSNVTRGFSIGHAFLEARQKFIKIANLSNLDPCGMKTIAQFILLGDPSVQPVEKSTFFGGFDDNERFRGENFGHAKLMRKTRRANLIAQGLMLQAMVSPPKKLRGWKIPPKLRKELDAALQQIGLKPGQKPDGVFGYSSKKHKGEMRKLLSYQDEVKQFVFLKHDPKQSRRAIYVIKSLGEEVVEMKRYVRR